MRMFWAIVAALILGAVGLVVVPDEGRSPRATPASAPAEFAGWSAPAPPALTPTDPPAEPDSAAALRAVAEQLKAPPAPDPVPADTDPDRLRNAFGMTGSGTAEDPHVVSWEALQAVRHEYAPQKGRKEVPAWIRILDGKHVRLTGYFLLPMASDGADELLVMLNQWDGCCIGVPPTPYDAVEVKLRERFRPRPGQPATYGSVEGLLKVEPYLAGDWLLGLYVLEDARIVGVPGAAGQARAGQTAPF